MEGTKAEKVEESPAKDTSLSEAKSTESESTSAPDNPGPSSGTKRKARHVDVEPRTPVKRQRVPVSRFQSPLEDIEPRFKAEPEEKKKDENIVLYKKGSFLAVRGAEGTFYLCRTSQNVYSKSKKLRIQWLSLMEPPNTYKFDYADNTEMETVLTEIAMDKVTKASFKLPPAEQKRVEKILDRAIRVEKGIATADEVEEEAMEEIEQEEEEEDSEEEEEPSPKKKGGSRGGSAKKSPPKGKKSKSLTPAQKKKEKEKEKRQKLKEKEKAAKNKKTEKKKGPDRNLKPNPKIKILEKDPFFESKEKIPDISPWMNAKLVFRAVRTGDAEALKDLLAKTEGVANFETNQSPEVGKNPLELAGELNKLDLIEPLTKEFFGEPVKRKCPPPPIIGTMNTGVYNPAYLGIRNIRALNASRGGKEGNNAFLHDSGGSVYQDDIFKSWMKCGVSVDTMDKFIQAVSILKKCTTDEELDSVIDNIHLAISRGHRALAAKYVAEAERLGGFGFNYLHKEVLNFTNENLRDIILAASVRKKPFSNDAITPLHCAAINPQVKYLRRLLSIEPDINIQTRSRVRPIHFAAACEGTGPLEFLLERKASPNETDSSGNLPIHYAARSGRSKNLEVLIKNAKSDVAAGLNAKWGLGGINRPNRFSMCPLHFAVEEGKMDAARTLIKLGADVNKQLSAGKNKESALMLAAQRGDLNMVRLLVESGAAVELLDKKKRSALTFAIMNGHTHVASYLLYLGADPNRVDSSNNSLVHYAAAYGWYFCLKLLVKDAGAKADEPNDWQTTPVGIALMKGHTGLVEYLINSKKVDINFKSDDGRTLISNACSSSIREGLDVTVDHMINNYKADPTLKDINGMNALHYLAANNVNMKGDRRDYHLPSNAQEITVRIARSLLEAGCDPSQLTNGGKTPVMLAIEQVNIDLVCFLVENGGAVSPEKNSDEKTVLHLMAEQCCSTDLTPLLKILAEQKPVVPAKPAVDGPKENGKVNNTPTESKEGEKKGEEPMEVEAAKDGSGDSQPVVNNVNGEKDPEKAPEAAKEGGTAGEGADKPKEEEKSEEEASSASPHDALKQMAQARDFTGFTPLLRACFVYKSFKIQQEGDEEKALRARNFIQALIELAESDVNAVVGPKNMSDEPEEHYTPEGKCSSLHFMVNPSSENRSVGAGLSLLLRFSPNTELRDMQDKTPLLLAIEADKESVVKALLEGGANPNTMVKYGSVELPPLIFAAERGYLGIMKLLIQYKADVNAKDTRSRQTAVHIMAENRVREDETIAMIQMLLQAGADINGVNNAGSTPLHCAVRSNRGHSDASTSLEEFLLDRGANVFAKDIYNTMPLHEALDKPGGVDPIELCSLLTSFMRDSRVDEPNKAGYTPLLKAAAGGATICCMHLLQRNANLEAKEHRGNTPLNMAVFGGHDSCAIMLMQRQANLSHPIVISLPREREKKEESEEEKKKKRPVLTWRPKKQWERAVSKQIPGEAITLFEGAVKKDLTGVAHMLLDAQGMPMEAVEAALNLSKFNLALRLLRRIPDVNRLHAKNKEGQNLFHVLALKTNRNSPDLQIKVAAALLEKRIPLGDRDNKGMTPLMYAALKHQSVALAKFLIKNDLAFNPKVKDRLNRDVMAAFMWDYKWVSNSFKVEEVREWLEVLVDSGRVSVDTLFDRPLPDPLLFGAYLDHVEEPEYFETHGGDLTSPLIFAIRNYDFGLAKFLLQKGASPNFCDSQGLTPMMHAVKMNDIKMVKLLLNYDYDMTSDTVVAGNLKPQLSKQQSRQVFGINFVQPKEKNPDDLADEAAGSNLEEDEAISMSKHTEEDEDSVQLDDNEDEDEAEDIDKDEDEEDKEADEEEDSDHDTDVVEEDAVEDLGPTSATDVPQGATKLSLTRHVSQMKKEREFVTVAKTSSIELSQADKNGWTALHHAVCSLDNATFDNAEIVYVLGKAGAPLEAKTATGETPMDLARRTDAENIVKVLNKLLAADGKPTQPFVSSPAAFVVKNCVEASEKPDHRADAEEMLTKLDAAAADAGRDKGVPLDGPSVDKNCELKKSGEIAKHAVTDIPYDVTLSKVDVTYGSYGMYNFYKLQIVKHLAKKMFVLFTRWGRIGDRGQYQHTPFQTLAEAAKEFGKIYKSKTGNDWNQTTKFINHPKKYRLMPKPAKQHKQHKVDFVLDSPLPTKLPEPVLDLMKEISSVNMFEASVDKVGLNEDFLPFGRMKRKTLLEARKVLTDLSELIDKGNKLSNNLTAATQAEYQRNCEEISQLTNEYYHLLPLYGFESEMIRPISKKQMLREHTKLLADLMDLEVANTILLGASLRKAEVNPTDYIYNSLGCSLQPLTEDDPDTQFILTNIHASVSWANINRVFKVSREGEDERLASTKLANRQLLWHGSSMANFMSILSRGLLVTPPEVPWTGHLFGEGIYFADTFQKSSHYCHNHSPKSNCKVMLLCEVALGNPKIDVKHGDEDHLDDDINSLKILGQNAPVTDYNAKLPFGASLPLGQIQKMEYHPPAFITHNEFIVHNPDQVAIRYLVFYNG